MYVPLRLTRTCIVHRYILQYLVGLFAESESQQTTKNVQAITKTCLYNFDPLKPHFYIVKLGFTGVYIIFLILL